MKKKLALLLVAIMCVTCLFTGCNKGDSEGTSSESGTTESGSEEKETVPITELYNKGQYEGIDMSEYVTIGELAGLIKLEESDYTVTEEEIQKEIDSYRESYGEVKEVEDRDTVQDGDVVNIDYVGRCSCGIKFQGGSATDYDLTIGSGSFIDGFESGLIGAKKGDTVELKVTFPSDYKQDADLAGEQVVFTVTINTISANILADYNDELVDEITNGIYTTVEEFNKYIETQLRVDKKGAVLDKLLTELEKNATYTSKVDALVEESYNEAVKYYEEYAGMYGYTLEKFATAMGFSSEDALREAIKQDATTEVHNELLIYAYGNAVGFTLSDEKALEVLNDLVLLQGYESGEEVLTAYGAEMIRTEVYSEALSDIIIESYK
ncbi:MAG: trigger factor [Agathobacter sp.]